MPVSDEMLVPGERVDSSVTPTANPADPTDDEEINERYVRGEIRIVVEQARYQLKQVPALVQSADYNLQPTFQRRPRWSREKQSRLIESFIVNVPVPPVFLYESELSRFEVMDGRQRLTAISEFYSDRFTLIGLTEWPELNGRKYSDLPEQIRRGIDRRYLSSIVLLHETAKTEAEAERLKQLVFERINTGGEDLTPQETRNALHPGPLNDLCMRLSRHPSFCYLWDIPEPDADELAEDVDWSPPEELISNRRYRTMEDVQLVLRFFAHRQRDRLWRGGSLDDYLSYYLTVGNQFDHATIGMLGEIFKDTSDLAQNLLGQNAFWLYRMRRSEWWWIGGSTVTAYDPMMNALSQLLDSRETLIARSSEISEKLTDFYKENSAIFDGRKVNPSDIRDRDSLMLDFMQGFAS